MRWLYLFPIFVGICWTQVNDGIITVDTSTRALVDSYGRQRLFHGVNVVYKSFPYFPITDHFDSRWSFSQEDMQLLQEWGLNVVRLGVMWPGVEPTRNEYNETYLDLVEQVIANMSDYGIYALIDCHQDAFSEKFCGEGVPLWAAQPNTTTFTGFPMPVDLPYDVDENGVPTPEDCAKRNWADYYPTIADSTAFQNLYDNYDGLLDSFAAYWQKLASIFAKYDNVIGYELINEPWAGDIYARPDLFVPTVADKENLAPMYDQLNTAIRQVDDQHLIFFEPVTWDDLGVGFEHVPGGDDYKNRSVLSYHIYIPPDITVDDAFIVRNLDLERLGCGGFLTEYDISEAQPLSKIVDTADQADFYHQSWIGWEYKVYVNITGFGYCIFRENGSIDVSLLQTLSRTYPMAVAGTTHNISYTDATKQFVLKYETSEISQPTDIYLNEKLNYPNGYNVTVLPSDNGLVWNSTHNHVFVWNTKMISCNATVEIYAI